MKKNQTTTIGLVARLIVGTLFLGLFTVNVVSFVQNTDGKVSFTALRAYAQSGGSGGEEANLYEADQIDETTETSVTHQGDLTCTSTRTCTTHTCVGTGSTPCDDAGGCSSWSTPDCI